MVMKNCKGFIFLLLAIVSLSLTGCTKKYLPVDYSSAENWAYFETDTAGRDVDVFFICPTVFGGSEDSYNMELTDEETKDNFLGAINMEKGIYDADARFFAPYYRQASLDAYTLESGEREQYLQRGFADVKTAFEYYYENCNDGRPIILAGFSQGADMCIRLMKDSFKEEHMLGQLVACYAIGWRVTEEETETYPQVKFAEGELDTGVIIAFNSEAEFIDDSLMIPKGTRTLAINPLNWRTDGTSAGKERNLGACFTDYNGTIRREIPALTGAYIDDVRGALKVTDVSPEEYPATLYLFQDGIYHLYDYQFFYRNLEQNVLARIDAYLAG